MTIPKRFLKSAEGAVASYDYTDIAEGTGIQTFYATQSRDAATQRYLLMEAALYPESPVIINNQDIDFDLTMFNLPKVVKGTAYVSLGAFIDGSPQTYTIAVQVRKWDGTAETNISSVISDTVSDSSHKMMLLKIPLTQTNFKKGDVLRLNVTSSGGVGTSYYGTDPMGIDYGVLTAANNRTTIFKFLCPFRIDL